MIRDQGNTPAFLKLGACSRYTLAAYRGAHLTCTSVALISKRLPNPAWSSWNWVCKKGNNEVLKNSYKWGQQEPLFDFMRQGLPLCLQCLFPALCCAWAQPGSEHNTLQNYKQFWRGVPAPRGPCCASQDNARVLPNGNIWEEPHLPHLLPTLLFGTGAGFLSLFWNKHKKEKVLRRWSPQSRFSFAA